MQIRIKLNEINNPACKKGCNKDERREITENDLCSDVFSEIDGLPVRCVGPWAKQKIYLLVQYFGIFSNAMKKKWYGKLNYIEICSGPGRCIDREDGLEFNGTSLSIIEHPAFSNINKALFFDFNNEVVSTLNKRITKRIINNAFAFNADFNKPIELCKIISDEINTNSLNIVFIDPTDCSIPFSLIKEIKKSIKNVDFIINIASGTDFNRNVKGVLLNKYPNLILKYSNFLNNIDFFENEINIKNAKSDKFVELRNGFRECYINSLKTIGYKYFDFERIKQFYDILFATENKKGIEFWNKAKSIKFDGQRKLF